eukprot:gene31336-6486_t
MDFPPCCGVADVPFSTTPSSFLYLLLSLQDAFPAAVFDNVFITLVISVQFQVVKEQVWDAFYKLTDSRQQISSYIFDTVRAAVPKMNLDDVFVEKEKIAVDIMESLTSAMSAYGYQIIAALVNDIEPDSKIIAALVNDLEPDSKIIAALVNDIEPDSKVKNAMNEINAARRLRVAALEKAEAGKVMVVKAAEAEAESKFLQGQGIARQRQAIVAGFSESIKDFSEHVEGIDPKSVLELMLITQYFDTLKDVGSNVNTNTVFLNSAPGQGGDVSAQMRNAFLESHAATK